MQWWCINLSSHSDSDGGFGEIADAFAAAFVHAGEPHDAAVFVGGLSSIGQSLYFSPGAYALAPDLVARFGGVPAPSPDQARLLVGGVGAAALGVKPPLSDMPRD